jgi:hypothetical protein
MSNAQNRKGDSANTAIGVLKMVTTNTGETLYSPYIKSHYPGTKDINIEVHLPLRTAQFRSYQCNQI